MSGDSVVISSVAYPDPRKLALVSVPRVRL